MTVDLTMDKLKTFPILLVEDNPGDARLVQEMLGDVASTEFDVHHVERLAEARERLMRNGTGCVLLDLSLPDANRLEALMQLRAAAPDVPIVILSGLQDELLAVPHVREDGLRRSVDRDRVLCAGHRALLWCMVATTRVYAPRTIGSFGGTDLQCTL